MTVFAQRRFKCLAAVALAGALAGCATSGQGPSGREDLKTASDQTSAQKRAAIRMQLRSMCSPGSVVSASISAGT